MKLLILRYIFYSRKSNEILFVVKYKNYTSALFLHQILYILSLPYLFSFEDFRYHFNDHVFSNKNNCKNYYELFFKFIFESPFN